MFDAADEVTQPHSSATSRWLLAGVAVVGVLNLVATVGSSSLLAKDPLLLVAFDAANRHLVLASPVVRDGWSLVAVASARRLIADPVYFALGRTLDLRACRPDDVQSGVERAVMRSVRRLEPWFRPASWLLVAVFPGLPVCFLAGASGMPFWRFATVDAIGTITVVTATRAAALGARGPLTQILAWNEANQLLVTALLLLATIVPPLVRRARRR